MYFVYKIPLVLTYLPTYIPLTTGQLENCPFPVSYNRYLAKAHRHVINKTVETKDLNKNFYLPLIHIIDYKPYDYRQVLSFVICG